MLSNRTTVAMTALAPAIWGTTYVTTTTLLVGGHPMLTGAVRALPAGLILLALARTLPTGPWWWRAWVLGALNIAAFFACLFVAAERLPGGVAAVVGGIQPLLVALLGWIVLRERMNALIVAAGVAGVVGVGLIVLQSSAGLSIVGTAFAYVVWFRGLAALPTRVPAFLGLLSPVVAVLIGVIALGEDMTAPQSAGLVLVLGSVLAVAAGSTRADRAPGSPVSEEG